MLRGHSKLTVVEKSKQVERDDKRSRLTTGQNWSKRVTSILARKSPDSYLDRSPDSSLD